MPARLRDIMSRGEADSPGCGESPPAVPAAPPDDVVRDIRTAIRFIEFYCPRRHRQDLRSPVSMKCFDLGAIAGHQVHLCPDCARLCMHAVTKRAACPLDPKPQCKDCPDHCYHPRYREQIREVMRFSGVRLVLRGRLDYLAHLLF